MTVIKTYCDKCGCELDSMKDFEEAEIEVEGYLKQVDLCVKCYEELTDLIESFFKEGKEQ